MSLIFCTFALDLDSVPSYSLEDILAGKVVFPKGKGFVVKDDTEYVFQNNIPLWMFGFLY